MMQGQQNVEVEKLNAKYLFMKLKPFGNNHVITVCYETRQLLCLWLSGTAGRLGANYRARCSDV